MAAAIINWNSGHWLRACIESLLSTSGEIELLVVDNASEDDSLALALAFKGRVRFVQNTVNRGFAAAVNQAFDATTASYILVLNPDVRACEGAAEYLWRFMDEHPRAGAVGGHVNDKYLPRPFPTVGLLIRENLGIPIRPSATPPSSPLEGEQPAAAALLIRRAAYDAIGRFDERFYPAWYEDVDFCVRLKDAGWQVYFAPAARFLHDGGYSARALGKAGFAAAYYRNQLRYVGKHFGLPAAAAIRCSIAIGMIARMAVTPSNARAYMAVLRGALGAW